MARTFWPHQSAIGKHVDPYLPGKSGWCTVVGVIADMKNGGLDKLAGTELFIPYRLAASSTPTVLIRTNGNPLSVMPEARRIVASLDPSLPIAKVRTMDDVVEAASARPRFLTIILGLFSILALVLATVGIYGVISYSVEQRTSEFGIKIALGAEPRRLLLQVIGQGLVLAVAGVAAGLVGIASADAFSGRNAVRSISIRSFLHSWVPPQFLPRQRCSLLSCLPCAR